MMKAPPGCEAYDSLTGVRIVRIHYSADPEKATPEWKEETMRGIPIREWEREMEMNEDVFDGEPVFKDYNDQFHCPAILRTKDLPLVFGSDYIGGWDCGNTLHPAFVLEQVTPGPPEMRQIHSLYEIVCPGESMESFAPHVLRTLQQKFPHIWDSVRHFGDHTVTARQGARGETAQMVARQHGIQITPVSNQWAGRSGAVIWSLVDWIDQTGDDPRQWTPRYYISGKNCPILHRGFQGGYRLGQSARGDTSGPGVILQMPKKNSFSHVADAHQAAMVVIKKMVQKGGSKGYSKRGAK